MPWPAATSGFDAFEALSDPAAILAADGALVRANAAFRATFRHWIGPQRPPWGRVTPPPMTDGERRFDAPAPDGRRFEWVERVLADGARLVTARDVSRYAAAAEAAVRAKTTLLATVTHELRTPLNGILGMASLLESAELAPNARAYVDAIKQSGHLLLDLITDILDYARLDAGKIALDAAPFDPETAMQDVAELLSPKAHAKGLEIAVNVRADAPMRVLGDDGRLRQILFNLCGNAVKFTEKGGVVLEMAPRPNERLRFSVRDTGPGIAPDKQNLIFEEFAQADESVARRHGGTGLGLAIVKKLTHAMGGDVGLSSRPGQGAHFWVELPLQAVEKASADTPLTGLRVRVAAENTVLAHALRATLSSLGAEVADRTSAVDIILVDWSDSITNAEIAAMRKEARAVIALAPQEARAVIAKARAAGIAHYTLKPVRRRSLAERIRAALVDATGEPEPESAPLTGVRVLLAEDNPVNALLARTLLARFGCIVTTVSDGREALTAANVNPFDLIFLDIRMPRLDGLEAARRMRAEGGACADVPIIALTADGEAERVRAIQAGMDDFVTKPIDAARLLAVAERFTRRANLATVVTGGGAASG